MGESLTETHVSETDENKYAEVYRVSKFSSYIVCRQVDPELGVRMTYASSDYPHQKAHDLAEEFVLGHYDPFEDNSLASRRERTE